MKALKDKKGFTLIETLIALVITVAAALLMSNSWSGNYLRVRKAAMNNNVALLLERKIVEIESKNKGKKILEISEEEGNFGDEYPQYRWKFTTQPFDMPDYGPMLAKQSKAGVDQMLLTVLAKMREVMGKAILEGTVTIYVKAGQKEVPFSVTTYFIDYDSEVEIGI